jgi:hypothetical protein
MVAPIDSMATFEVEGEKFTLRLNFRSIALAKAAGVDLLGGMELDPVNVAVALRCLAVQEHPDITDEEAFAVAIRGGEAVGKALTELFTNFGGKASAEGNAKPARVKAKA